MLSDVTRRTGKTKMAAVKNGSTCMSACRPHSDAIPMAISMLWGDEQPSDADRGSDLGVLALRNEPFSRTALASRTKKHVLGLEGHGLVILSLNTSLQTTHCLRYSALIAGLYCYLYNSVIQHTFIQRAFIDLMPNASV